MKRHRRDSGFAMLMVFLMAAMVAIMLYMEMPRFAFEAERQRELLLIDRGNQFKRAIQVFYTDKANQQHRFPASIDELLSFNNKRFLRKKYKDPMTGKDEWRFVHMGPNGMLTDSVTTQNNLQQGKQGSGSGTSGSNNTYITELQALGASTPTSASAGAGAAQRRRASENAGAPGSVENPTTASNDLTPPTGFTPPSNIPAGPPGGFNPPANIPGAPPTGIPGAPPGGFTGGAFPPGSFPGGSTGTPGGAPTTPPTGMPPSGPPGFLPGQPGNPVNSQVPGAPGQPPAGFTQPGNTIDPAAQPAAAAMINNLLTNPRPGGAPTGGGLTLGGGIAGVASKFEAEGIMVINDRTAINEWEFWFDLRNYRTPMNPISGTVGQQAGTPIGQSGGPGGPGGAGGPGPGFNPLNPAGPGGSGNPMTNPMGTGIGK